MIMLSLIPPIIIFALLRKKTYAALTLFLIFSIASSIKVNPLYIGTSIITSTPLSVTIKNISNSDNGRWVTDESALENITTLNGTRSLSGVYAYPQLELWRSIEANEDIYNRYAHTNFVFDRNRSKEINTTLIQSSGDNFGIVTEPCGKFLEESRVKYILTATQFSETEDCLKLITRVVYPNKTFYIYQIK